MTKNKLYFSIFLLFIFICMANLYLDTKKDGNHLISSPSDSTIEDLIGKKTGIYVFGYADCPWCKQLYPVLEKELKVKQLTASIIDIHEKNFTSENREDLNQFIIQNTPFNDVIVPIIFLVSKDDYLQYHVGTLENHDATQDKLTSNQIQLLKNELDNMFDIYMQHNSPYTK